MAYHIDMFYNSNKHNYARNYCFKLLRTKLMYMPYTRYNFLVHELLYKMYMYSSIYKSVSMLFIIVLISQILKS